MLFYFYGSHGNVYLLSFNVSHVSNFRARFGQLAHVHGSQLLQAARLNDSLQIVARHMIISFSPFPFVRVGAFICSFEKMLSGVVYYKDGMAGNRGFI